MKDSCLGIKYQTNLTPLYIIHVETNIYLQIDSEEDIYNPSCVQQTTNLL